MRKRKLLYHSNASWLKTGFGRFSRQLLKYLWRTNKFEIVHLCGGIVQGDPQLDHTPWKSIGCIPANQQEIQNLQRDPAAWQRVIYGDYILDSVIQSERPDIYYSAEDFWSIQDFNRPWMQKINWIVHTTLDSVPILQTAIDNADKIKNFWVWASFAERELKKLGKSHVQTIPGAIEVEHFYKLSEKKKLELREKFNLPNQGFCVGAVMRNQLRKTIDRTIEGYAIWKRQNNIKNSFLLIHTSFSEGWPILKLADEFGVPQNEIYTTYICKSCKDYHIANFQGEDQNCPYCKSEKSCKTVHPTLGVSEFQLNEIYGMMDCLVNSSTSGGYEYSCYECKLAEIPLLVPSYSYGEDLIVPEAGSLELEWSTYKEIGSAFTKSSVYPSSIAKQINRVYNMDKKKRDELGLKARHWVIANHSTEIVYKRIIDTIDAMPDHNYNFEIEYIPRNPNFVIPEIQDDTEWLKVIYKNILLMDDPGSGLEYWMGELKKGASRQQIIDHFRSVANSENQKNQKVDFSDLLIKNDKKNLAVIQPGSIGDLIGILGILESLRMRYPSTSWNFYMITEPRYFEIFEGCEFIDKLLPFQSFMEQPFVLEGCGANKGFFNIVYQPFKRPQRTADYTHNGADLIDLEIK